MGYVWECIPCLVATRNRVGASWHAEEAKVEQLRTTLFAASLELTRWGFGDMHYGPTGRDPKVTAMLDKIEEALDATL